MGDIHGPKVDAILKDLVWPMPSGLLGFYLKMEVYDNDNPSVC